MEIYTVTFCTMDPEVGANILWHTCILLSRFDETTKKMEVVDTWGFYGLPSTDNGSLLRPIKIKSGLDVDFSGNHGMLRHEDLRFLEMGCGLHGVTFELTQEKFIELQTKCQTMAAKQLEAINDIVKPLNLCGREKSRIYPYESQALHIFSLEKAAASEQRRSPRLKEFKLSLFQGANTCKVQAIKLLDGVLTPKQIERITGYHRAVSRFSGKMENIYLHSTGPLRKFVKSSGEVIHNRNIEDDGVKLYWTIPPQEIETITDGVKDLLGLHKDHVDEWKGIVKRLQRLEWLFINASLNEKYAASCNQLVDWLRVIYSRYALISPREPKTAITFWPASVLYLLSLPRDSEEKEIVDHIALAKDTLNSLYMAAVEDWDAEDLDAFNQPDYFTDRLEMLAVCLTPAKIKDLCAIIGRTFIESKLLTAVTP